MTPLLAACACLAAGPADVVVSGAQIWSGGMTGFAEFAAIRAGRFIHVGLRDETLIGPETRRVEAQGRVVVPGLFDSHVHMLSGGLQMLDLQLRDATDKQDFIRRVAEWTRTLEPGEWVLGGRWSTESWSQREQPAKDWVDGVTGDHPLFLPRMDGHSALANTAALRRAGITAGGPPDPPGGVIDRDPATGEPSGILRDRAMGLVSRHIPPAALDERLAALRRAMAEAVRHGVTAVSDIPDLQNLDVYERLDPDDQSVRFFLYPTAADWSSAAARAKRFRGRPGWLEIRGFKAYLDGSLGSRTASMREPFLGNPPEKAGWRGLLREGVADGTFARNVGAARRAGYQVIAHAIGDRANHLLLDTLESVYPDLRAARCRSEHAQHLLPADIQRFGDLGVIASMQPFHKADDGRYAEEYLGAERCRWSYAYRSLLDAGAVVAFGSDWPVVTINPFPGIEAAVTGRTLDGRLWQTQETIPVGAALRCYTSGGAFAVFAEDELGRIAAGYRADFVVLSDSPFDRDVQWQRIEPVSVYVEGQKVYGR